MRCRTVANCTKLLVTELSRSGHAGEFHPCIPTEPYVKVSFHVVSAFPYRLSRNPLGNAASGGLVTAPESRNQKACSHL